MSDSHVIRAGVSAILCGAMLIPGGAVALAAPTPPAAAGTESLGQVIPAADSAPRPAPVLVISSYRASVDRLVIGKSFDLSLDIANKTGRTAENVVVSLGASGVGGEAGAPAGGLTVLGTGNAKYLGRLSGRGVEPVGFEVVAGTGTPPGVMTVPVTISFEYDGERHELPYTIGLVFERDAALTVTLAEHPTTGLVGEPFEASFEVANAGGFPLQGVAISVESTGAEVADGHLFVGALDAAGTEGIDVSVTPKQAGPMNLDLVVNYRDDLGRDQKFTTSYTIDVEEKPDKPIAEGGDVDASEDEGNGFVRFLKALFGIGS